MSVAHYNELCHKYKGRAVEITTKDGKRHRGIIGHVDGRCVYLQSLGGKSLGGFGFGFWGLGAGIALGSIATLALLPFFFW
ncbi:hypothetical protein J2Z83_001576 [Virgibacillus natechei]|uniref:Uncharacterized protein n=1 Tax=Virgibacillus natechei TaxID=1216297 RepID=A0ABS4IEU0_9BACI|nr:hypothetical protein [Virgibacillus natechei]MBP1969472.1 hypothetical protein [Virgibacillus natechei]UZD11823.1 hypothetical protein OLD84_12810 [Virgibacillus natechei]